MAKKSVVERNNKRCSMNAKFKHKHDALKATIKNKTLSIDERFQAQIELAKLPRNSSSTRIRNRCALTGRGRGYIGKFGLSRICVRQLANEALLPGITKASW
jgi:small subunit ribosomal protein S14